MDFEFNELKANFDKQQVDQHTHTHACKGVRSTIALMAAAIMSLTPRMHTYTQAQAHRVVKDVQKYMKSLEAMMQASKSLGDSIKTVYEPDWPGSNQACVCASHYHDIFTRVCEPVHTCLPYAYIYIYMYNKYVHWNKISYIFTYLHMHTYIYIHTCAHTHKHRYNSITGLDLTYQDVKAKLSDQFAEPLKSYLGQFPDIKKRVDKRDRRQLDHDRCKRAVEAARQKGMSPFTRCTHECTHEYARECTHEYTREYTRECTHECTRECTRKFTRKYWTHYPCHFLYVCHYAPAFN